MRMSSMNVKNAINAYARNVMNAYVINVMNAYVMNVIKASDECDECVSQSCLKNANNAIGDDCVLTRIRQVYTKPRVNLE